MYLSKVSSTWVGGLIGFSVVAWISHWQISTYAIAALIFTQLLIIIILARIITSKYGIEIFEKNSNISPNETSSNNCKDEKLIQIIKDEISRINISEKHFTLNNIYDENGMVGHDWNVYVDEGHWVITTYNEKSQKFTVKHMRSKANNALFGSREEIIKAESKYNKEQVFGYEDRMRTQGKSGDLYIAKE